MQKNAISLRTTAVICGLFFLTFACNKPDHGPGPLNCLPKPACDVQSLETFSLPGPSQPPSGSSFRFTKTYGADGRVSAIKTRVGIYSVKEHNCAVKYNGRHIMLIEDNWEKDTTLSAELNRCGNPERAVYYDRQYRRIVHYEFQYDQRNRLSRSVARDTSIDDGISKTVYVYQYDKYDNVIKIYHEATPSKYLEMTYDYGKPLKGARYYLGFGYGFGIDLFELLGHLNLQPHHQLKTVTTTGYEPELIAHWEYTKQQVNAEGYLQSYEANLWDNRTNGPNSVMYVRDQLTWNCGRNSGPKY